ncbi:MAG TPA: CAP domain-containing protein [Anaerolineales bacterium]|nr:CAP domain-containing protein [Anaerolineales bacterium]
MTKKLLTVASLLAVMLSACGGQTSTETITPVSTETQVAKASPTATETSAATETATLPTPSVTQPADTATPQPTVPTNPPDCTNSASFVMDVTIPDNSDVVGGAIFTKTWRVRNTGTCVWGPGYRLEHYSDEQMGVITPVQFDVAYPGEEVEISVDLRAANSLGTHRGNFVIKNPAGLIMSIDEDSRLWVIINVTNTVTMTPTATRTPTTVAGTPSGSVTATSTGATGTASDAILADVPAACSVSLNEAKLIETITAVNAYRARNNLPAYDVDTLLSEAAQRHANDLACNNLFVHRGSDGSSPQSRVVDTGYVASSVSENVYGSYPPLTGQGVVDWWINDKTDLRHNQNMLSTTFTEIGVGYSFYENFGYFVLVFGNPEK